MKIRLTALRERADLTLEGVAEVLGNVASTVQRWESGVSNVPSKRFDEIADLYQCRISDFFDDGDSGRPTVYDAEGGALPAPPAGLPSEEDLAVILRTLAPLLSRVRAEEDDFPMIAGLLRTAANYRRDNPHVPTAEFEGAVRMLVYHTEKRA